MSLRRRAFSLAELMIVISIIVLMLALAVPAFNFITGSKSQSSGNNQIAAILGRARSEAIGLQEVRGVFFFLEPTSGRYTAMMVRVPDASTWSNTVPYTVGQYVTRTVGTATVYFACIQDNTNQFPNGSSSDPNWKTADQYAIDAILPDADSITLPAGVGVQVLCDSKVIPPASRTSDGYLSAGAVLFDAAGRVINKRISVCYGGVLGQKMGLNPATSPYTRKNMPPLGSAVIFESSYGYVLYDRETFLSQSFTDADFYVQNPQLPLVTAYSPSEQAEETWLDSNGYAVLINRYNGSLIKSE